MKEIWKSYRTQPTFKVDWNVFVCLIMAFDLCDALRIFSIIHRTWWPYLDDRRNKTLKNLNILLLGFLRIFLIF